MLVTLLIACSVPCESMRQADARDRCFHERVATDPEAVSADAMVSIAGAMHNTMVRDATVLTWARGHRGALAPADVQRVCSVLAGFEYALCERRLSSAHLHRTGTP